jgi:hypothetical protein
MNLAKPALILFGLTAWSGLAMAQMIGNPVPDINDGKWGFGLSYESFSRDLGGASDSGDYTRTGLRVDYGLSKNHALQLFVGGTQIDSSQDSWAGPEIGFGYRQPVDIAIPMGSKKAPTAVFGDFRYGSLGDGTDFKYFQYEVGYGGSYPISKSFDVYAALLYSDVYGRIDGRDVSAVDHVGLMTGLEFSVSNKVRLTGELHVVHEIGFGLLFQYFP